jgi:hypothetical protein
MPEEHDQDEPRMKGFEKILNSDADPAQKIWDRGINDEAFMYLMAVAAFKAGVGPDPCPYTGPVVDFEKAAEEVEETAGKGSGQLFRAIHGAGVRLLTNTYQICSQ